MPEILLVLLLLYVRVIMPFVSNISEEMTTEWYIVGTMYIRVVLHPISMLYPVYHWSYFLAEL